MVQSIPIPLATKCITSHFTLAMLLHYLRIQSYVMFPKVTLHLSHRYAQLWKHVLMAM